MFRARLRAVCRTLRLISFASMVLALDLCAAAATVPGATPNRRLHSEDACTTKGMDYMPAYIQNEVRTLEDSWQDCQRRCKRLQKAGCAHFMFWPVDGGCNLADRLALPIVAIGYGADGMLSGPPSCEASPTPGVKSADDGRQEIPVVLATLPSAPTVPAVPAAPALAPALAPAAAAVAGDLASKCPGSFTMAGHDRPVAVVPTGWEGAGPGAKVGPIRVASGGHLETHMNGRGYFADRCTGAYDNNDYLALHLLGKRLEFSVNLVGAGCGCNAAFYLVSMRQNTNASTCGDYYCDANRVCGISCDEIDIMEANQFAFHSTLHTLHDHSGVGGGYGGGSTWNGPRDFTKDEYGPWARCIDTTKDFKVSAAFPTDAQGILRSMEVEISQAGANCSVRITVDDYAGNARLTQSLAHGMTPVFSYWRSGDMLWLDGEGADHAGPCRRDLSAPCGAQVRMYGFKVESLDEDPPSAAPAPWVPRVSPQAPPPPAQPAPPTPPPPTPPGPPTSSATTTTRTTTVPCSIARKANCMASRCCHDPGLQCYEKDEWWAACQYDCTPGVDPRDDEGMQTPWTCRKLGHRTPGAPHTTSTTTTPLIEPGLSRCAATRQERCSTAQCCRDPGMQCYEKDEWWSACLWECESSKQDPWTCRKLGPRTKGHPNATMPTAWAPHGRLKHRGGTEQETPKEGEREHHEQTLDHDSADDPKTGEVLPEGVDPDAPACSETFSDDCTYTQCCQEPGMRCYQKDPYLSFCRRSCDPDVDHRDPEGHMSRWSCRPLGSRTPTSPAAEGGGDSAAMNSVMQALLGFSRAVQDGSSASDILDAARPGECAETRKQNCAASRCCAAPGMRCYEKNEYWAACQLDCTPGVDPRDRRRDRTPWTCRPLGPRAAGDPNLTTNNSHFMSAGTKMVTKRFSSEAPVEAPVSTAKAYAAFAGVLLVVLATAHVSRRAVRTAQHRSLAIDSPERTSLLDATAPALHRAAGAAVVATTAELA